MARPKLPAYLTARAGTGKTYYLWQPATKLRKRGWKTVPLKDLYDRHATLALAVHQAEWLNALLAAWRAGDKARVAELQAAWAAGEAAGELAACDYVSYRVPGVRTAPAADPRRRTVAALAAAYQASVEFAELAPKTREGYASHLRQICEIFGDVPVQAVTRRQVRAYYRKIYETVSLASANARLRTFRLLLSFAVEEEWLATNPLLKFRMSATPPRVVIWRPEEAVHLVATADRLGEHGVADAFVIALHSAQRRGDILKLPRLLFRADRIALAQSKRGALVDIAYTPQLQARVRLILERRSEMGHEHVPTLVVDDRTGRPFRDDTFSHRFQEVRTIAAADAPTADRTPAEPAFADKWFSDTRDTAITRLALADLERLGGNVDLFAIAAISGHSMASITQILKHYVSMHRSMADRGIKVLVQWMEKEGMKL